MCGLWKNVSKKLFLSKNKGKGLMKIRHTDIFFSISRLLYHFVGLGGYNTCIIINLS